MGWRRGFVALGIGAVLVGAVGIVSAAGVGELPARVVVVDPVVTEATYDSVHFGASATAHDDRATHTTWRVVEHTGNCCENNLTTTPDGRLLDFGGQYVTYSDDRGVTWLQAQPLTPLVAGEGAVVAAPGGDVLGVTWDLNAAEQLMFFKYEGDTEQWLYTQMPLHTPYFDREWIGVVPGPVTIRGETFEYVSLVRGGAPNKESWFYSTDGLTYLPAPSPALEQLLGEEAVPSRLPTTPDPVLDWAQPNTNSGMVALGGGRLLVAPDLPDGLIEGQQFAWPYGLLDGETFTWSSFEFLDGGRPPGWIPSSGNRYQVDSAGRIHNVRPTQDGTGFAYRISQDGGETWRTTDVALPPSNTMDGDGAIGRHQWDFRANLTAGVGAVAIRTLDATTGTNRDLVYKFDITGDSPELSHLLHVGQGDAVAGNGTAGGSVRMDFGSLAIFEDGRVALSFLDSTTTYCVCNLKELDEGGVHPNGWQAIGPAIAIELETAGT